MRNVAKLRAVVFSLCFFAISTSGVANAQIAWQTNLQAAHAQAKAEGKLLLLHFFSDNCVYCERLEAGSFKSAQVGQAIQQKYVPVKIHGGNNAHLTEMFKVTKYPTDVIVRLDGTTVSHTVSPQEPARYVAMLTSASQTQVAAKPRESEVSAAKKSPVKKSVVGDMPVAVQSPAGGSGPRMNQFAVDPSPAKQNVQSQQETLVQQKSPTAKKSTPAKTVSAKITDGNASVSSKPTSNKPELAMQGFCPVTVIKKDQWVEGNPKHGVIHLGKLYLFADVEAMEMFLADPVPYTPVLNEIDVVRYFEERRIVPGKREWGLKDPTHNRMFFFADEAAMNHFWNEYERYTGPAIKVMEKAVKDANPGT